MKLLLTSAGISNQSIAGALSSFVRFNESRIVFIPTAANPEGYDKAWLVDDIQNARRLGWKALDILDPAAMSSLPRELWWPRLEQANVLMVGGGNTFYLSYWLQKSGLFEALPELLKTKVYVGISAGSMVTGESLRVSSQALEKFGQLHDEEYDELGPKGQSSSKTLRLVNFCFRPHLNSKAFPRIRDSFLQQVARELPCPMYALDDQSAVKVVDDKIEVISEGQWKIYNN